MAPATSSLVTARAITDEDETAEVRPAARAKLSAAGGGDETAAEGRREGRAKNNGGKESSDNPVGNRVSKLQGSKTEEQSTGASWKKQLTIQDSSRHEGA